MIPGQNGCVLFHLCSFYTGACDYIIQKKTSLHFSLDCTGPNQKMVLLQQPHEYPSILLEPDNIFHYESVSIQQMYDSNSAF